MKRIMCWIEKKLNEDCKIFKKRKRVKGCKQSNIKESKHF